MERKRRGEGLKAVRIKLFRGTGRSGCAALRVEGGEETLARHRSTVQRPPLLSHKNKTAALSCPSLPLMMTRRIRLGKEGSHRRPGAPCVTVSKRCVAQRETQQETTRSVRAPRHVWRVPVLMMTVRRSDEKRGERGHGRLFENGP